jgi:nucleoside-diphosphate-sugar epimerase
MRIFVSGASGFVGSAVVAELVQAGHQVLGLARSDSSAQALVAAGAQVQRGDLNDLASLHRAVAVSDAVIHTAFNHDFSRFPVSCEEDRQVITAMGVMLAGTGRPLIVTSAIAVAQAAPGQSATEDDSPKGCAALPRAASEEAALAVAARGGNVSVLRLSQVHDRRKQGLISDLVKLARDKGVSAFVGEGQYRWPAAHVGDVARLYRLAVEKQQAGAVYHAVAEEGITLREIAEVIGHSLGLPSISIPHEEVVAHFGWLAKFATLDMPASGAKTQALLDCLPQGPGLISDLQQLQAS